MKLELTIDCDAEDEEWALEETVLLTTALQQRADSRKKGRALKLREEKKRRVNVCSLCNHSVTTKDPVAYSVCYGNRVGTHGEPTEIPGGKAHQSWRMDITSYFYTE